MTWDEALSTLHQAPHGDFVAERKRLSGALKSGGDKDAAGRLMKVGRPPISAWAVNQLWWHAHAAFEDMLASAKKLKGGALDAMAEHKAALRKLHDRAKEILEKEGNAASIGTLSRIDTTLSAIAAAQGFDPDLPGTLSEDRDPPGFAALGIAAVGPPAPPVAEAKDVVEEAKEAAQEAARAAAVAEQETRSKAQALEKAEAEVEHHRARVAKLEAELAEAKDALAEAKKRVTDLG